MALVRDLYGAMRCVECALGALQAEIIELEEQVEAGAPLTASNRSADPFLAPR